MYWRVETRRKKQDEKAFAGAFACLCMLLTLLPAAVFAGEGEENDAPETAGKTYSEDYVHSLRNESAGYRTTAKMYESALRSVLGLGDGEEIGDLNSRLSSYRQALKQEQENTLKAANSGGASQP